MKYAYKASLIAMVAMVSLVLIPFTHAKFENCSPLLNLTSAPSLVERGEDFVSLSWDSVLSVVEEDENVPSYKVFYSDKPFDGSETEFVEIFGATEGTIDDLTPGTEYHFGVVAVDLDGCESRQYSDRLTVELEGSENPEESSLLHGASSVALVRADAVADDEIRIIFNSDIILPDEDPETAFTVHVKGNPSALVDIDKAEVDEVDEKIVYLITEPMASGTTYLVIAGVNVSNSDGNNIKSGVIDRAEFTLAGGSTPTTDPTPSTDPIDPSETGTGSTVEDPAETGTGSTVEDNTDPTPEVTLQNVENLMATLKMMAEEWVVALTWKLPSTADNATGQVVYQSTDGKLFNKITDLAPTVMSYQVENLLAGNKYWFKVTRKNGAGEESDGALSKVIELPASGPEILLLMIFALGTGVVAYRRFN